MGDHGGGQKTLETVAMAMDEEWAVKGASGVTGDQTVATVEIGRMSVENKINDAVAQIRSLVK